MDIRLAVISELPGQRKIITDKLSLLGKFKIVYQGESLSTDFNHLVRALPDIIILSAVSPLTFRKEVGKKRCQEVADSLPDTKILLRTNLPQDHTYIKETISYGVNIINDHCDWSAVASGIEMIMDGKKLIHYE